MTDTEENNLSFSANMTILPENEKIYAIGNVTVDHLFCIHDVKVVYYNDKETGERKMGTVLPDHFNKKKQTWEPCVQLTKEQKKQLDVAVNEDLKLKIYTSINGVRDQTQVRINLSPENFIPTVAYADLTYRDMLTVKGIRVTDLGDGRLNVIFPANEKDGKYRTLIDGIGREHSQLVAEVVITAFQEAYESQRGKPYEIRMSTDGREQSKPKEKKDR